MQFNPIDHKVEVFLIPESNFSERQHITNKTNWIPYLVYSNRLKRFYQLNSIFREVILTKNSKTTETKQSTDIMKQRESEKSTLIRQIQTEGITMY